MLWVCLRFPQLALDALRVDADPSSRHKPRAIVDGPPQRRHIRQADVHAGRCGVRAGQALAAALALCPKLVFHPRDIVAERQTLESLASWAYRFSAEVHPGTDAILLEAGASLGLFGGWSALERRLRSGLARFGFGYTLAAAPTATAAQVFAAHADGILVPRRDRLTRALGAIPLAASGLDADAIAALRGMGFHQLGELFALPRAELTRRIGAAAILHLDRVRGLVAEVLPRWQPPARFERRIEFSYGVTAHTALAFPLRRLIQELATFLTARDGGVQRFTLRLEHENGTLTPIVIGLLAPQRDAASLFELARARLDRVELPAPAHALGLHADDLPPLCPQHRDLFEQRRQGQLDGPALIERLRARLGDAAVRGLAAAPDHRPHRAWRFVPVANDSDPRGAPRSATADTMTAFTTRNTAGTRPFWLLHRPALLHDAPARILTGPERIESGWWDTDDCRRDYYIVETRHGQRAWAYVEVGAVGGWVVHGWFA